MVTINNLMKNYGSYTLNISMEIPNGQVVGLIGKNGAGKSTTIKAILGLIKPDSGEIMVSVDKEEMGIALSETGFSPYLNIKDIAAVMVKLYKDFNKTNFLELCRKEGLPLDKSTKEFSTGMKAKVRVLVAMSHRAKLLILDEPTAGLDIEARQEILDMIRNYLLEDDERSVLITSHIASDLEGLCDDIYLIHDGKVLLHEETDIILSEYAILKADKETYAGVDKTYVLGTKEEEFGVKALVKEKQYYMDNYPNVVIENGGIDDLIIMLTGGK